MYRLKKFIVKCILLLCKKSIDDLLLTIRPFVACSDALITIIDNKFFKLSIHRDKSYFVYRLWFKPIKSVVIERKNMMYLIHLKVILNG